MRLHEICKPMDNNTLLQKQMNKSYYIASCVFTSRFPKLSEQIQEYIRERHNMEIVRCCVPKYRIKQFEEQMPEGYRDDWKALPDTGDFASGDTVYSLCHNCSAIIEETKPGVTVRSLWELILSDSEFRYPDYGHQKMMIQDCWRAKDRRSEQEAVRELLHRLNIDVVEQEDNYEKTDFCGNSLFRPAPVRNLKLAPHRFVENAQGKFGDYTLEEQREIMQEYCKRFQANKVLVYCHYCLEGLKLGGADGVHIASLLFENTNFQE